MSDSAADRQLMLQALKLAQGGRGYVEPNPLVGCVVARQGKIVGTGWHRRFGGPHAEIEALDAAGDAAAGADVFVTLEPCCHIGKTPPCTQTLINRRVARVIVGCEDPNPQVAGQGLAELRAAGIETIVGVCRDEAVGLIAPFTKLITLRRPWVIAKWAMTLDGKLATRTGDSRWISGPASRAVVHKLRGVVDAIVVGARTVMADDPLLTARPSGPRTATRVVLDSSASLPIDSKLVRSVDEAPILLVVAASAPGDRCDALADKGIEILQLPGENHCDRLALLLDELGRRQMTNLLVEGGAQVFGSLLDLREIDELHTFVAAKFIGGVGAPSAIAGAGIARMSSAITLDSMAVDQLDSDLHIHGRIARP